MSTTPEPTTSAVQASRLEAVAEQISQLLLQPSVATRLRSAPDANTWSALQVIGHMTEMIPYWLSHCQTLIAASEPPHFGRAADAPERLAGVERGATANPDELVAALQAEIQAASSTIRTMSAAQRSKRGINTRRGEMTVADIIELFIVSHAEEHLAQVQAVLLSE
jgi:uncharacterized damage-inducible protein DinB